MLGVVIGVWSVVSLLAIGAGAQQTITSEVESIGTNLLTVLPGIRPRNNPRVYSGAAQSLTLADADIIRRAIPEVAAIAPDYQNDAQVVAGSLNRSARILGVTPEYAVVRNVSMASGQFLTEQLVRAARPVAVLGSTVATELFGVGSPIGQKIRVKGQLLTIVGVLQPGGAIGQYDNAVIVPITTAHQSLFGGGDGSSSFQVSSISLQVRHSSQVDLAQSRIEELMRRSHNLPQDGTGDDFTVFNQASLLTTFKTVTTTLTIFLGTIAGISLLVGGIGVMNIMLVSVTERTREIGLRKAVGAKRKDILRQFLTEALMISLLGGLVGLALGFGTVLLIGALFSEFITPVMTLASVVMALGFSIAVGLFFGIYPARRAARLNPIQALRFD